MDAKFIEELAFRGSCPIDQIRNIEGFQENLLTSNFIESVEGGLYRVATELRRRIILNSRFLKFSEFSLRVIEAVAAAGKSGITQADLSRDLGIDSRNLFHYIKPLVESGLVLKVPLCQNKSFTFKCVHSRWAADLEDLDADQQDVSALRTNILATLGNEFMDVEEVLARFPSLNRRRFNRILTFLSDDGLIEVQTAGKRRTVRRIRSEPVSSESIRSDHIRPLPSQSLLCLNRPLEAQFCEVVGMHGEAGATLREVRAALGLGSKLNFRLGARLTDGKQYDPAPLRKISEFVGKRRQHRLFLRDQAPPETVTAIATQQRDSVNRTRRQQAILRVLAEQGVAEVGRPLALAVQQLIGEGDALMDHKTVRRLVELLAAARLVRTTTVVVRSGSTRLLVIAADVPDDDERVRSLIAFVKRETALFDAALPTAKPASDHKTPGLSKGFLWGWAARARCLHRFLVERCSDTFETVQVLFKDAPLGLLFKLTVVGETSAQLLEASQTMYHVPLSQLPKELLDELAFRAGARYRVGVRQLLKLLEHLGLINGGSFAPIGSRLPFQCRLNPTWEGIAVSVDTLDEIWARLKQRYTADATEPLDRYDRILALPDNWRDRPEVDTTLRRIVSRTARFYTNCADEGLEKLRALAEDYDVPFAQIEALYRAALARPRPAKRPRVIETSEETETETEEESSDSPEEDEAVIVDDERIRLVYLLLHEPEFQSSGRLVWTLIDGLFSETADLSLVKRKINFMAHTRLSLMRRVEQQLNLVRQAVQAGLVEPFKATAAQRKRDPKAVFKRKIQWYEEQIAVLPETIKQLRLPPNTPLWQPAVLTRHFSERRPGRIACFDNLLNRPFFLANVETELLQRDLFHVELLRCIRVVMTSPADGACAQELLSQWDREAVKEAAAQLLQTGVLSKSSTGKARYHLPGLPYALSDSMASLATEPLPDGLYELEDVFARPLDYCNDPTAFAEVEGACTRLRQASLAFFESSGLRAWHLLKPFVSCKECSLNTVFLRNCILSVYKLVRPGISLDGLLSQLEHQIGRQEVLEIIEYLKSLNVVCEESAEGSDSNCKFYFPQ